MNNDSTSHQQRLAWAVFTAVIAVFAWLVIREAWLCDDAFITLRVVDNFHNGYGLRWNVVERVQVFTHPLWCLTLLILTGVFGNLALTTLWFSIFVSITAFALIVPRPTRHNSQLVLLALMIPASKAVAQYATSGLEGPLSFLLLALLVLACGGLEPAWNRWDRWVPLLAAAVVLTRQDLLLVVAPLCVAWLVRKGVRQAAVPLLAGASAVAVWELFTLIYYGSLVPNTALAKLNTGMPFSEKAAQGLGYLGDFVVRDPSGFFVLALCLFLLVAVRRDVQARAVAVGIALYVLYIVSIGGDFMSGRFFTAPLFLAVAETIRTVGDRSRFPAKVIPGVGITSVVLVAVHLFGFNGFSNEVISRNGIADERKFYAPALSLGALLDGRPIERVGWVHDAKAWRDKGPSGLITDTVGLSGFYGGADVHILDVVALSDPLLSRLPAKSDSRVGHFERRLPAGYKESLLSRTLQIQDPDLNEFCGVLWSVTRGPVWSTSRLGESIRLIAGTYDPLLESYLERSGAWHREPGVASVPTDFTIERLFVPEENLNLPADDADATIPNS
jgi:arabinofuranosyltransferase